MKNAANDNRIRAREGKIRELRDEIAGLGKLIELSQAYIAYLIASEHGGHVEVEKEKLLEYINAPERVKTRIDGDKYIIDVKVEK